MNGRNHHRGDQDFANVYGPWAVIVGASQGTGAAFSRQLAAQGLNVVLIARRLEALEALSRQIRQRHGAATRNISLDLSRAGADRAIIEQTQDLDIGLVIYNVGSDEHAAYFLDVPAEEWVSLVQRNCITTLLVCHHFARRLVSRGHGGIILVSSGAAWAGGTRLATYAATKAFDLIFGELLWAELSDHGVDVLSLVLGMTDTPTLRNILARTGGTAEGLADPEEVAREGLANLGNGPSWIVGDANRAAHAMLGSIPRRDAVRAVSDAAQQIFGSSHHQPPP